jgi:hypothetical protein
VKAYIYQAALLCEECGDEKRATLAPELLAIADRDDNSDIAPQGPYAGGGGEADVPQHCDHCGAFLCNPLTADGVAYVMDKASEPVTSETVREWCDFYDISPQA